MARSLQSATASRSQIAPKERRVVATADRQEGVIARRQLIACGLGNGTITRWLACGRLHRVHPGVYVLGHRRVTDRGKLVAALLYAGPGAALAGRSGAAWWGVTKPPPRMVEVATPHRRRSVPGVRVRHRPDLERVEHRGLPVTPLARTLLDLATLVSRHRLRKALAEADYLGFLDPSAVLAECGPGREGSAALRSALAIHNPLLALTRNELEEAFLGLCERSGLPIPELNHKVGPYEVDALWEVERLIVELDGGAAHGRPAAVVRDRARDLYLRERGYRVVRYSWIQVFREPGRVAVDLRRALDPDETLITQAAVSNSTNLTARRSGSGRS